MHRTSSHAGRLALIGLYVIAGIAPHVSAQIDLTPERPPEVPPVFRDYFPQCNAHGPAGMLGDDYTFLNWFFKADYSRFSWFLGIPIFHSYARGMNGSDGNRNWSQDLKTWHKLPGPETGSSDAVPNTDGYWAPIRFGNNWPLMAPQPFYEGVPGNPIAPTPIDRFQVTRDLDGDGVCDFLSYGWDVARSTLPDGTDIDNGAGQFEARSGSNGQKIWSHPIAWNRINGLCNNYLYNITGFPTGMLSYNAPAGPRYAWKTTDITYAYDASRCPGAGPAQQWITTEHITIGDAKSGAALWTRTLLPSVSSFANSTYLTGVGDLGGSDEPDVVLDNVIMDNNPPLGCAPPVLIGITTLRGEDGATLWPTRNYFTPLHTGDATNLDKTEEDQECFVGAQAKVIHDVTGDGHDEVVGTYLTREATGLATLLGGSQTTSNGLYRTHIAPIDGVSGKLLWQGKDLKQQGWGRVTDVTTDVHHGAPYIAVAVIDVPTPTQTGSRFPPKDVRMTVLKVSDGTSVWGSYQARLPLDTYLTYDLVLQQYGVLDATAATLAPKDYDGDGIKDLVTPGRYHLPNTTEQILLASSGHEYLVLSGATGKTISKFEAFGPRGRLVTCPGAPEDTLTIMSGHGKRQDISRVDVLKGETMWRHAVYVNRRAVSQVAGRSTIYQMARCGVEEDQRTMFMQSDGFMSYQRNYEIIPVRGFVHANGTMDWMKDPVRFLPPNTATLSDFRAEVKVPEPVIKTVSKDAGLVGLGLASAFGAIGLRNRRRNGGGGVL